MEDTTVPTKTSGEPDIFRRHPNFLGGYGSSAEQSRTKSPYQILADMGFEEDLSSDGMRFVRDNMELVLKEDDCPQNPRDNGTRLGIMALDPDCDYDFGDEQSDEVPKNAVVAYPLYAHIHGSITLAFSTSSFYDAPFDTGQLGFVYTTREHMTKYGCRQDISKDDIQKIFQAEINEMNHYLAGSVFYYVIQDIHEDTDGLDDSCSGFYGSDDALGYAAHVIKHHDAKALKAERAAVVYP